MPGKQGPQPNQQLTIDILQHLLLCGADPLFTDKRGRTALHQAAKSNNIVALDFLLNNTLGGIRSNVDAQSLGGETALMMAVDEGNLEVMQLLFVHNPDPTFATISGRNVYHFGLAKGGQVMESL